MKVIIFTTAYFPMVGGAEVAIKEITDRLRDIEFELYCAKMRSDTKRSEKIGNVTVHRIGFGKSWDKFIFPVLAPFAARFSRKEISPVIWSVMASYGGFAALFYSWLRPKARFVLTLQEGDPLERYEKNAGIFNGLRKKIFTSADRVHTISRFLAGWAKDMGANVEPVVIPNGVDLELFTKHISEEERNRIRSGFAFRSDDIVLVTASRLTKKNAVDDIVRALTKLPEEYKLLVLGGGEDEAMLKRLAEEEGVSHRIFFYGKYLHTELSPLLQSSDIFIRPSRSEGLGIAFLEAMAAGLPVIATPVGGIPDFLLDGETGVFCQPEQPESLAEAVMRLRDHHLREKLIGQSKKLVHQKYGWDAVASQIKTFLGL